MLKKFKQLYSPWNLLILIIILFAFILRIYRIGEILNFHYDQGRDALVIWNLWHNHKLFLIGPVTGLEGIFLGPFYYYLIAPFYLIGAGNPAIPSIFLSFLVTISLYFLYRTGVLIGGKVTGFIALMIGSFSNFFVFSNRWLSNPTPIYLTSILIFYLMVLIIKNKVLSNKLNYVWWLIYLLVGISFHFELASAIFYLPVLLVFTYWQRKKINIVNFLVSIVLLFLTFLPQIIFNFKHDNILFNNFIREFSKNTPRTATIYRIVTDRLKTFWDMFYIKVFPQKESMATFFSLFSFFGIYKLTKLKINKDISKLFIIFLAIPAIGYIIYRGNYGILYDYYFTGYYFILTLLFSWGLSYFWKSGVGKLILTAFLVTFLFINFSFIKSSLLIGVNDGKDIFIANQLEAVNWIFEDSINNKFNVDVYVPPVIPYSYDYLLQWEKTYRNDEYLTFLESTSLLYTLYEEDPPHPARLEAWLERQKGIGIVEKEYKTGGITVQRRKRI